MVARIGAHSACYFFFVANLAYFAIMFNLSGYLFYLVNEHCTVKRKFHVYLVYFDTQVNGARQETTHEWQSFPSESIVFSVEPDKALT